MNVHELLVKISDCLLIVSIEGQTKTDAELEPILERVKFLWIRERPLILQNQN